MGEARERGLRLISDSSLAPISDGFGDTVFQDRAGHIPVEEPTAATPDATMVQWHNMSIECYFLEAGG